MAPNYPWQKSDPSSSTPSSNNNTSDRPIVVSASARAILSPNSNLAPDASPSTLRARNSPRNGTTSGNVNNGGFSSQRDSYPSPSAAGASSSSAGVGGTKGKVKSLFGRRRKDSDADSSYANSNNGSPAPARGWKQIPNDSPGSSNGGSPSAAGAGAAGLPVRKFDARGYPLSNGQDGTPSKSSPTLSAAAAASNQQHRLSPEKSRLMYSRTRGKSQDSLASEASSTAAAVGDDWRRQQQHQNGSASGTGTSASASSRASHLRPITVTPYGTNGTSSNSPSPASEPSTAVPTPASLYPPVMNYSLAAASYSPADGAPPASSSSSSHAPGSVGYFPQAMDSYEDVNNPYDYGYSSGGIGGRRSGTSPLPSLYDHDPGYGYGANDSDPRAQSSISVATQFSTQSMTHFRKYDTMQDSYGAFSISSKGGRKHLGQTFSLPADPSTWSYLGPEADDEFHDPDIKPRKRTGFLASMVTLRGAGNIGCLAFLLVVLIGLFAVYPITFQFLSKVQSTYGAYNLGGINATGQIPDIGPFQLIDRDTPASAYTHRSLETGEEWELVFSDEFSRDGRTFWPGDDPYWEAQDLHYWGTNNKEWYDPEYVTTDGGKLKVTLSNVKSHGLNYTGGMINTWNRFCFTGGYLETSVSLPGKNNVYGLWPAIWTLGNLGRAGYGGTLDGVWPYSYDSCDLGTLPNQTLNGRPLVAPGTGDSNNLDHLSYLPGQRLSRCTCQNDPTHPGPKHPDGSFVGRAAPEIDVFEAVIDANTMMAEVSQSAQWAPFNPSYQFDNRSANFEIYNSSMTYINPWQGSVWQQATTALSYTDRNCYTGETGCSSIYGFEYATGDDGYITWVNDGRLAWTVRAAAMGANNVSMVSRRPIPEEPMYLIINLGISENFGPVDYDGLEPLFPVHMDVDYVRVYQDPAKKNIGCDPPEYPTAAYIERFKDVYANPNIIPNFSKPKNRLVDTC